MRLWPELSGGGERDNHTEIYHHCCEAFSSFVAVFRFQVKSDLYGLY